MAAGVADAVARVQRVLAMATCVGHEVDDRIHALSGDQGSRVARMPRLPTAPSSTPAPATPFTLSTRESTEDGGFEVVVEFCCRNASCRSRSQICFCASATRFCASAKWRSRSANSRRSRFFSRFNRSWASALGCRFVRDTPHNVRRSDQFVQRPELSP
jgi:hypothetical protein